MKNKVVFTLLLAATAIVSVVLTGCSSAPPMMWGGTGVTSSEINQYHYEAIQTDLWQLQDDIDAFFLFDRPGRMNRLSIR